MADQQLVEALRSAGLQPCSLNGLSAIRDHPVIKWLAANLSAANVVDPADAARYDDLKLLGIEDAPEPESALLHAMGLETSNKSSSEPDTIEFLQPDHDKQLEEESAAMEQQIALLEDQIRQMRVLSTQLERNLPAPRQAALAQASLAARASATVASQQSAAVECNTAMNAALDTVTSVLKELALLCKNNPGRWLLLAADAKGYQKQESAYLQQLTRHVAEQQAAHAAQGAAPLPGSQKQGGSLPVQLLGVPANEQATFMAEVQRLRWIFQLGETQKVAALTELAGLQARLAAEQQLLRDPAFFKSHKGGEAHIQHLQQEVQRLQQRKAVLLEQQVPGLCKELGLRQDIHIMDGEYQLKLLRQSLYCRRKVLVVEQLLGQAARQLMLETARKLEQAELLKVQSALRELNQTLTALRAAGQERMGRYAACCSTSTAVNGPRTSLHPEDAYLARMHEALTGPPLSNRSFQALLAACLPGAKGAAPANTGRSSPDISASKLLDGRLAQLLRLCAMPEQDGDSAGGADRRAGMGTPTGSRSPLRYAGPSTPKSTQVQELVASIAALSTGQREATAEMEHMRAARLPASFDCAVADAQRLHRLLFLSPSDSMPTLTHPSLADAMAAVREVVGEVAHMRERVVKQHNDYQAQLRHSRHLEVERQLLEWYFTKPHKLQEEFSRLQQKLRVMNDHLLET